MQIQQASRIIFLSSRVEFRVIIISKFELFSSYIKQKMQKKIQFHLSIGIVELSIVQISNFLSCLRTDLLSCLMLAYLFICSKGTTQKYLEFVQLSHFWQEDNSTVNTRICPDVAFLTRRQLNTTPFLSSCRISDEEMLRT